MFPYLNLIMGAMIAFCGAYAVRAIINWRNGGEEDLNAAVGLAIVPAYILLRGAVSESLLFVILVISCAIVTVWRIRLRKARRRSELTRA